MIERRAVTAGVLYCAVVFTSGFVLGAMRTLMVAPLAGEFVAVTLEAPVILAVSWATCGWVTERFEISEKFIDRLVMGGVALAVLLLAEAVISILADGQTLAEYFLSYSRSGLLLGLLAQLAFAVFPILRRQVRARL